MNVIFTKDKVADSVVRFVRATATRPVTFQVDGTLGGDVITIKGIGINGADETALHTDITLTAAAPVIIFTYPIRVIIEKPITTNNVGLMEVTS